MGNSLMLFVPKQLEAKKRDMDAVVRKTETEELHITFTKMQTFFRMFEDVAKAEITRRAVRARAEGDRIITSLGSLFAVTRHNYSFDGEKLDKWLKKNKVNASLVYNTVYSIATDETALLEKGVKAGILVKEFKIDVKKFEALAEQYPRLLDLAVDEPTVYVKGL